MTIRDGLLSDFTAGHISSEEGRTLIAALQAGLGRPEGRVPPWRQLPQPDDLSRPARRAAAVRRGHPDDTAARRARPAGADHLPRGTGAELLSELMQRGQRRGQATTPSTRPGSRPASRPPTRSGSGARARRRASPSSPTSTGSRGRSSRRSTWSAASACSPAGTGSTSRARPDTSTPTTRPRGVTASRRCDDHDIVCVHVEAPDEASHEGRADAKVEALERIDRDIVGPLRKALETSGDWRILISPDHATLLRTRAHDRGWVAWAMAGTGLCGLGPIRMTRSRPARPTGPCWSMGSA